MTKYYDAMTYDPQTIEEKKNTSRDKTNQLTIHKLIQVACSLFEIPLKNSRAILTLTASKLSFRGRGSSNRTYTKFNRKIIKY